MKTIAQRIGGVLLCALVAGAVVGCGGAGESRPDGSNGDGDADAGLDGGSEADSDAGADAGSDAGQDDGWDGDGWEGDVDGDGSSIEPECDHYSSPQGGGAGADGSQLHPWGSLESMARAGQIPSEGTLCLMNGHHGQAQINSLSPSEGLTIRALEQHQAVLSGLSFSGVSKLTLWGLKVDGSTVIDPQADERQSFLVTGDMATSEVVLDGVLVQSAESCERWDQDAWVFLVRSGIDFRGSDITIQDCEIRNTYHALLLRGDRALVNSTLIDNFGGDAIRGLGNDSTYTWNTVRDAYINEYEIQHDDAFQAYRLEGDLAISKVTISHNRFILFADPLTEFVLANELVGTLMQGIIITDGYADGWLVDNNLIVSSQQHGISLYGGRNCRVQNNTVVAHPDFVPSGGPWIRIADQTKTGHENFDNIIRNNLAQMLTPWDYDSSSLVEANMEIGDAAEHFLEPAQLNFHLIPGSDAVNSGVTSDLATVDLDGLPRLQGSGVDLGAFELP